MSKNAVQIPGEMSKEDEKKLISIIETIEKEPIAYDFLQPVDTVGLGLIDYFDFIKKPMDLGTLKNNLKLGSYSKIQQGLDDLQLIWNNCKHYNLEGSEIYKMAENLEKLSKRLIDKSFKSKQILQKQKVKEIKNNEIEMLTWNEKVSFTEGIRQAEPNIIASIVENLIQSSPGSIQTKNNTDFDIIVDMITKSSYENLIPLLK